ncbi:hypothetical protein A2U01_0055939, partial [Trifolium medium]|nr:hypothetical protein [Trifolium medium]
LGAVPSTVHLKMKYHDEKGGVVTIEADMDGAKKCHQSMHKTVKKTDGDTPRQRKAKIKTPRIRIINSTQSSSIMLNVFQFLILQGNILPPIV